MNRAEARELVRAELKEAQSLGYERLSADAPTPAAKSEQPRWPFRRWIAWMDPKPGSRVRKEIHGKSGSRYQVVREIDWDGDVGGALRVWAYVDDFASASEPEIGDELIYPPAEGGKKLSEKERQRWWRKAGRWQLQQLLLWRWDPIGVNDDFPFTTDEYDSYLDPIASLLGRGAGVDEIAAYLQGVEEDEMELGRGEGPDDHCHEVARLIADWHRNSISSWLTL